MKYSFVLAPVFFLASCGVYQSSFECPPGKGVGCARVGEVLELIVEKEEGEDLFVQDKGTALILKQRDEEENPKKYSKRVSRKQKPLYLVRGDAGELTLITPTQDPP